MYQVANNNDWEEVPNQSKDDQWEEIPQQHVKPPGFLQRVGQAAFNNLPSEGAFAGGLVGGIPGAAIGGVAGGGLKRLIQGFQNQGKDYVTNPPTVQGSIDSASSTAQDAMNGASQEASGRLIGGGINKIGSGLGKVSDYLAQKAMGMKKTIPGVGNTALDEGVWGTKAGMRSSMSGALDKYENKLQDAVGKIKDPISTSPVAQDVLSAADKYQTAGGRTTSSSKPFVDQAINQAADVEAQGSIPASEALELKRINQRVGFRRGEPLESFKAKLAQTEARGYGQALEDASANEGMPGVIPEANSKLHALLTANKAVNAPDKIKSMLGMSDIAADVIGGAPGVLASKLAGTPLAQSSIAKGIKGTSDLASSQNLTPLARLLMGLKNTNRDGQ